MTVGRALLREILFSWGVLLWLVLVVVLLLLLLLLTGSVGGSGS